MTQILKSLLPVAVLGSAVMLNLTGCNPTSSTASQMNQQEWQKAWENPQASAESIVAKMTPRERIGQLIMLDFRNWGLDENGAPKSVTVLPKELAEAVSRYALGSVVLFRENLVNTEQSYQLIQDLQKARYNLPLFVSVDQEGGYVTRLQEGTELPGNMALAATRDVSLAKKSGEVHGSELKALGFNINFGPVLDVNVNQKNPIIGVRSYSNNIQLINEMSSNYIEGIHSQKLLAVAKHFPGHGNVDVDSHVGLPMVPYSEQEWRNIDLVPFKYAIDNKIDAIMTAHVIVPALDDTKVISKKDGSEINLPATLSKKILTGILRDEMKFDGLIMTDALDMGAISDNFGPIESVEMALLAGVDVALMPVHAWDEKGLAQLDELFQYLENGIRSNSELADRINESAIRVVRAKLSNKIDLNMNTVAQAKEVVGSPAHKTFEKEVAEKAVTLIKNDGVLPYHLATKNSILLISDEHTRNGIIEDELSRIALQIEGSAISFDIRELAFSLNGKTVPSNLDQLIQESDFIILTTYNLLNNPEAAQRVVNSANRFNKPLVAIASRNPYDIAYLKNVKANIAIYGVTGFDITNANRNSLEANIRAGVRSLFTLPRGAGSIFNVPNGKLPVDIRSEDDSRVEYRYGYGLSF